MTGTSEGAGASRAADWVDQRHWGGQPVPEPVSSLLAPRWQGQRGRLEVWYLTLSDPERDLGCWVHHEVVATSRGGAYKHGWAAVFGAGRSPVFARFGPEPASPSQAMAGRHASTGEALFDPPRFAGSAGRLKWDLDLGAGQAQLRPMFTFPRWAWEREILPGAQVVPVPSAKAAGTVEVDGISTELSPAACGAIARIYGRSNPGRWGWLHADLGGGDVLEVVAAAERRAGLHRLRPLGFVQLRRNGKDWPSDPLLAATRFRARLDLPEWELCGTWRGLRLTAKVRIPLDEAVTVGYTDPDGRPARCTNSEVADAEVLLASKESGWKTVERWDLRRTAHAEIGLR